MLTLVKCNSLTASSLSCSSSAQVRDQEMPVKRNFAKVVIYVEDCNDHSPAFLSPRYEASISNQAPTGSEVIRVKALDKDMGTNAEISYSLHTGEQLILIYACSCFLNSLLQLLIIGGGLHTELLVKPVCLLLTAYSEKHPDLLGDLQDICTR